ncbi:hypothetical protein V8F06_009471 [Rhypophila decipiens]
MTTSFREVQYASGAHRSEIPDTSPDPICQRIHIGARYRLSGGPGRRRRGPQWSRQQVNRLTAVSPALRAHINELRADEEGNKVWNIQSRADDGISGPTVSEVLEMLALDEQAVIEDVASVVSEFCNVLWFYQVIPTRFPSCVQWVAIDNQETRNIIGALNIPPPLRHVLRNPTMFPSNAQWAGRDDLAARNIPPPLRQATTDDTDHSRLSLSTVGHASWCWNEPTNPHAYETDLHLANCAFILDWRGVFRRAIRTVVWETRPADIVLHTPVKYLKLTGPEGINKTRHREKEHVMSQLLRYLIRHRATDTANVDNTITLLSDNGIEVGDGPSEFEDPNVYQLLRRIEAILLPSPSSPVVPGPGRVNHARRPTHGSSQTSSSSGSNPNGGPPRNNTDMSHMTSSSTRTRGGDGRERRTASGGGPSSSSHSLPSSPPPNRSNPSWTPMLEKINSLLSSPKSNDPRAEPEPDPGRGFRGGPAGHADFVRRMLDAMHEFLLERHAVVAEEMHDRRESDIAGWKESLRNLESTVR